jgi:DNA recombination protein RmuC
MDTTSMLLLLAAVLAGAAGFLAGRAVGSARQKARLEETFAAERQAATRSQHELEKTLALAEQARPAEEHRRARCAETPAGAAQRGLRKPARAFQDQRGATAGSRAAYRRAERIARDVEWATGRRTGRAEQCARKYRRAEQGHREKDREALGNERRLLEENRVALKQEFQNLANQIFEEKHQVFARQSSEGLNTVFDSFRKQMFEFKSKVEDIHLKDTEQQAILKTELAQLKELNRQMTEEAHSLATALKGSVKMQGNWGELVLENVLDRSGLRLDVDYRREVSFDTEQGRQRPDVVVYLPDDKHLVIDSKVSMNAYTRFVNAVDDSERAQALKEHVAAVASRIKELADRNYFQIEGLNSPEMVFMFIPIESAFVEALKADEALFSRAIEQNVLVATPTTLLTSLNIVRQLWRFEERNEHTAELARRASRIYKKLNTFLGEMDKLGRTLDSAKKGYTQAMAQLYAGKDNLIKQASEFEKLGVSVQGSLPEHLVRKARMELEHVPDDDGTDGGNGAGES